MAHHFETRALGDTIFSSFKLGIRFHILHGLTLQTDGMMVMLQAGQLIPYGTILESQRYGNADLHQKLQLTIDRRPIDSHLFFYEYLQYISRGERGLCFRQNTDDGFASCCQSISGFLHYLKRSLVG